MAEETTMTPVDGIEPPKANPLAKPAGSSSTLKLKPIDRAAAGGSVSGLKLPSKPGLATAGLKLPSKPGLATAGLKLPPKPGLATAGLKLPPKPGLATQTGLKLPPKPGLATQTGLKLPPKPGLATQTGLKLPPKPGLATAGLRLPTKPTIRKPGSAPSMARPSVLGTKPVAVTGAAAAAPAPTAVEEVTVVAPVPAPVAPAPAAPASAVSAPAAAKPEHAVADLKQVTPTEITKIEKPLDALKSVTQNLKSITAPIPQQAILRKTGIIADEQSDGQKQAVKAKTSRISLSEAMGAAPVLNENAPMKTIRIKRPIDIPGVTKTEAAVAEPSTSSKTVTKPTDTEAVTVVRRVNPEPSTETPTEPSVSMTQRKTLKIARPTGGVMRPSGKFGIKRPGTLMAAKAPKPPEAAKPAGEADAKAADDVPEIADIPSLPTAPVARIADGEKDLPKGVTILGILVQTAACVAMGVLALWLYADTQILPF